MMSSPISSTWPPAWTSKTRPSPFASSTTEPATPASIVTDPVMHSADPEHMWSAAENVYVPLARTTRLTPLLMAAVSSPTVVAHCDPGESGGCAGDGGGEGGEGGGGVGARVGGNGGGDGDGGDGGDVPTTLPSGQTPRPSRPGTKYPVRESLTSMFGKWN